MAINSGYPINLGLGDSPDPGLDGDIWAELLKLQLAAKYIAAEIAASPLDFVPSGSNPALTGSPAAGVTIQNYSKLRRVATVDIPAGSVLELNNTQTFPTSGAYPFPSAYAEAAIPAGTPGEVILLGMVYYPANNLTPGAKYYVEPSIAGGISTAGNGRFVGQAFASNILFFDPVRD